MIFKRFKILKHWNYLADLLVVIAGIIIALSLDAWWQNRQDTKHGEESLVGIYNDLETQKDRFQYLIYCDSLTVTHGRKLMDMFNHPEFSIDSMEFHASKLTNGTVYVLMNSYYEALKSTGNLENIRNTQLKKLIIRYYENDNIHVSKVTDVKIQKQLDFEDALKPFAIFSDPVDEETSHFQIKVIDNKKALKDTNWKSSLYQFIMLSEISMSQTKGNFKRANQIQEMIKSEVNAQLE